MGKRIAQRAKKGYEQKQLADRAWNPSPYLSEVKTKAGTSAWASFCRLLTTWTQTDIRPRHPSESDPESVDKFPLSV